ncbi:MAG: hypothetical protein ABI222_15215 [Opitutaceae bacterium]
MENKQMMKLVSEKVGKEKAIEIVMQAYNTELMTTWIARMQAVKPIGGPQRRNHLGDALERVVEVCQLVP